ncbi:MAG: hypothetical protein KF797_11925 [Flavobacteriales bacterium]|nr:hypothetical protein [Flavobacteriales bacterium]
MYYAVPHSIHIRYDGLVAVRGSQHYPISELQVTDHIHGSLVIDIGGRLVPYMGYWGVSDVCFGQWLEELRQVSYQFSNASTGQWTFDEGEQGQPAFVFERFNEKGFLTIAPSDISGAEGDANWERVEFSAEMFLTEYARFRDSFLNTLRAFAPNVSEEWMRRNTG